MCRKLTSSVLSLMILWSVSYQSMIVIHFYLNQGYITDVYCVNKYSPEKACNGQCYLTKSLEESNESEPLKVLTSSLEQKFTANNCWIDTLANRLVEEAEIGQATFGYIIRLYRSYLSISAPPPQM